MTIRLLLGVGACLLLCTGVNSAQLPEGPLVIGKPGNRIVFRGQNADPLHVPGMGTVQTNHKTGEHAFVDEEGNAFLHESKPTSEAPSKTTAFPARAQPGGTEKAYTNSNDRRQPLSAVRYDNRERSSATAPSRDQSPRRKNSYPNRNYRRQQQSERTSGNSSRNQYSYPNTNDRRQSRTSSRSDASRSKKYHPTTRPLETTSSRASNFGKTYFTSKQPLNSRV
ncbi:hypothetical protein ACLKA7_014148 [Drosophila subpalustris]